MYETQLTGEGGAATDSPVFAPGLLTGRTALVTGGGSGIGFAIAGELGGLGARVFIASRNEERLRSAAARLAERGVDAAYATVDIRDVGAVEALLETVADRFGVPDYLINNAGGQFAAPPLDISTNGFRAVVDLNLSGTWHVTRTFAAQVLKTGHGGKIVNIVLSLENGLPDMVHAGAARAGVINLTRSLALAWGPHGLTVNAVAPGSVDTAALTAGYDAAEIRSWTRRLPIKRLASAREVALAVAYLLSPAGDYVTGTTLFVDGGEHLMGPLPEA